MNDYTILSPLSCFKATTTQLQGSRLEGFKLYTPGPLGEPEDMIQQLLKFSPAQNCPSAPTEVFQEKATKNTRHYGLGHF